jgi:hypothetical protein
MRVHAPKYKIAQYWTLGTAQFSAMDSMDFSNAESLTSASFFPSFESTTSKNCIVEAIFSMESEFPEITLSSLLDDLFDRSCTILTMLSKQGPKPTLAHILFNPSFF